MGKKVDVPAYRIEVGEVVPYVELPDSLKNIKFTKEWAKE